MIFAILFGLFVGSATQLTLKNEHCKSINFDGKFCELQKKA